MSSPSNEASSIPSYNPPPNPYDNLIKRVRRLIMGRGKPSARERALAALVASTEAQLEEARRRADVYSEAETPLPVTQALRSPKGGERLAVVRYDGMIIKAMLRSQGRRNPGREAEVWRCLRETAIRERERYE